MAKRAAALRKHAAKRADHLVALLTATYPQANCALDHSSPFELLAATILSAQCTDKRVNLVTPALFAAYPTAAAMAAAPPDHLAQLVQTTGFFRSKSRHLRAMAEALVERHGGQVPNTMAELIGLPGVARKTASVVLGVCFGLAEGIVVDTHVMRLAQRLGLTAHTDAKKIELDLMRLIAKPAWIAFSHRLIVHGRTLCKARTPLCAPCPLQQICPSAAVGPPVAKRPAKRTRTRTRLA